MNGDDLDRVLRGYYPDATEAEIETMRERVDRARNEPPILVGAAPYEPTWRDDLADGVKEFKDTMKRDKAKRDAILEERTRPEVVIGILGCLIAIGASVARLRREVEQLRRM